MQKLHETSINRLTLFLQHLVINELGPFFKSWKLDLIQEIDRGFASGSAF